MRFEEIEKKMRVFESAHDLRVLPDMYIVARIDGRSFSSMTRQHFRKPFDERFRDIMIATVHHLMNCGFHIVYGYTQSDEISLLFDINDTTFSRQQRKINSVLAAEASAKFTLLSGVHAAFDCRVCALPNHQLVSQYFRWRYEDAARNALNAHCYWRLREEGCTQTEATQRIVRLSGAEKNELLFAHGTNFAGLPLWQKRGIGIYWQQVEKEGYNPKLKQKVRALRRQLFTNVDLPTGDDYSAFIDILTGETTTK